MISPDLRDTVSRRVAAMGAYPLAYARLWHRPPPRTSQRVAAQKILDATSLSFVNGGNRAGKTDLGAQWAVAHALGRDNPIVKQWADINSLDISRIQRGPGVVWAVSLTFSDSKRYVRDKLNKYLPTGTTRLSWGAENEAEAQLPGGGKILCKAWSQGRGGFQGDAIHAAWVDEEPPDESAFTELMMRTPDHAGRILVTFTPGLMGLSWVYEKFFKDPNPDIPQYSIHGTDNPYIDKKTLNTVLSGLSETERSARERGEWVNRDGMIFPHWSRQIHVIPAKPIPPEWKRFRGIDFGFRDPFACVWVARDPSDGLLHLYRVLYQTEKTAKQNGDEINRLSKTEVIEWTVADSADASSRRALTLECDINTIPAQGDLKAIGPGIELIFGYLQPGANGMPGLVIHSNCIAIIKEIEAYRWAKNGPSDINNHAIDALRYLLMQLKKSDGIVVV